MTYDFEGEQFHGLAKMFAKFSSVTAPLPRFWSQMCHDDALHQWLEGLLETFPRAGEEVAEGRVAALQDALLHKLFLVFVRLCTYKESATDFFTPEHYGTMIYDKYLLEVPKILDICVLFGPCNPAITARMVVGIIM